MVEEAHNPPAEPPALSETDDVLAVPCPGSATKLCRRVVLDILDSVTYEHLVHVFPENFKSVKDLEGIPDVLETGVKSFIEFLADALGCTSYKSSYMEFWFLDMLSECLIKAQADGMSQRSQKCLIVWYNNFVKEILHTEAGCFKEVALRLKQFVLLVGREITKPGVPIPLDMVELWAMNSQLNTIDRIKKSETNTDRKQETDDVSTFYMNLNDLLQICDYLINIYGDKFRFKLLNNILIKLPQYAEETSTYPFNFPKLLYVEAKKKSSKKVAVSPPPDRSVGIPEPTESELERATMDKLKLYILPLNMAVDEHFFTSLWPIVEKKNKKEKKK